MVQQVSHSLVYKTYSLAGEPSHSEKNYVKYTDEVHAQGRETTLVISSIKLLLNTDVSSPRRRQTKSETYV